MPRERIAYVELKYYSEDPVNFKNTHFESAEHSTDDDETIDFTTVFINLNNFNDEKLFRQKKVYRGTKLNLRVHTDCCRKNSDYMKSPKSHEKHVCFHLRDFDVRRFGNYEFEFEQNSFVPDVDGIKKQPKKFTMTQSFKRNCDSDHIFEFFKDELEKNFPYEGEIKITVYNNASDNEMKESAHLTWTNEYSNE